MEQVIDLKLNQVNQWSEEARVDWIRENQKETHKIKSTFIDAMKKQDSAIMSHITNCTRSRHPSYQGAAPQKRPSQDLSPNQPFPTSAKVPRLDQAEQQHSPISPQPEPFRPENITIEARPEEDKLIISPTKPIDPRKRVRKDFAAEFEEDLRDDVKVENSDKKWEEINRQALSDILDDTPVSVIVACSSVILLSIQH